ncbi:LytR family transcriptional regulator [Streptococcus sp. HMSC34B10]|uniref:LCP family protein n=1 Tax=Streptococcus sp. HMSC34B10 TaxID=1608856 RepID=UPI0008A8DB5E|nr:LCP family protein [Streptococcus sp. HMSC34B10]OHS85989.1 LytR family transcriptional regulator [Streptococcus sp. HMSC34B10]
MSKENPLSHHEKLRYDYLLKNIYYLNDKEKREFAFLQDKLEGKREESSAAEEKEEIQEYTNSNTGLPSYTNRSRANRRTGQLQPKAKIQDKKKPKTKRVFHFKRILAWLGMILLVAALGMLFMFLKGFQSANPNSSNGVKDAKAAQVEVFNGQDTRDGVNILILGTDGRIGQNSAETRTDSIMVLNVSGKDKKLKLVSFMRDNLVYIDGYSQVINGQKQADHKLNLAYELGEQEGKKGAEMVRKVLKDNFDLDIKYYALVDFQAFATAIDTLFPDGVTIDAQFSTLNGAPVTAAEVGDDLHEKDGESPTQIIRSGTQQMNGSTLLNYARFRDDDEGDYGRTRRQQQVMTAVLQQIKDPTKLFTGSEALGKVFGMTSTNLPYTFLLTNGLSVLEGGQNGIEKLTIPELGDWVDDYDVYGGQALRVNQKAYQNKLAQMGFR